MSSYAYNSKEESTPSASFQKLCQQLLDGSSQSITKQNIEDFRVILHMIMHDCSKANIEAGKIWIFDHCQTPQHMSAMLEYIQTLALSRSGQKDRIHMVYLVNDVLYHSYSDFVLQ
ncbi:hypothetical protein BDF20DRAFT_875129 [Mycotypha africana]|uniref:uncharacterized protein n=1 Tax=Mycotypha africana TaxID=64632 RepID=UPI0023011889|nr:uncharacterized protein BDF20DRAFT_875129 [Mycotypha africana]KAI8977484.1 hypothetical protein BDF20DRAFT_875129 [Mycotypha africana]